MRVKILGAVEADVGGRSIELGTRKQRALLAALALSRGRATSPDQLVDLIWGDEPPPGANSTLHVYVAGLRRALEPDRAARATATVLVTKAPGYALALPAGALDVDRFEAHIRQAGDLLGAAGRDLVPSSRQAAATPGDVAVASELLAEAIGSWRGVPFLELAERTSVLAERTRVGDLLVSAHELAAVAGLASGDHARVAAELEALTAEHPLRERLWSLRAVALTRAGRQADALAALRQIRELLADELGIDPGEELRSLEAAVLRQDPALLWRADASGPTGSRAEPSPSTDGPSPATHAWPLVGRRDVLAALTALVGSAELGSPQVAALVGEPGIEKSRLCAELAAFARDQGVRVVVGRCSQDEGAPALWPWAEVLEQLGAPGPPELTGRSSPDQAPYERFQAWDAICRSVLSAASHETLLVVLDDLHWADASSLHVLRHLLTVADTGRLLVVATWRTHPAPTGAHAEAAEALARRHALRVDLAGLTTAEAGALLASVAGRDASDREVEALRRRTDGNPFYLVEYARLLAQHDGAALPPDQRPSAVTDVLARRLAGLPADTLTVLRAAAVLGRSFPLRLLAEVTGDDDDTLLDHLDPALAAGLVDDGVDHFRFAHALVRDAAYESLAPSRRARLHARAAQAMSVAPNAADLLSETARHWLAAGPSYAARAWRTAVDAAGADRSVHAHEEVRHLLQAALAAQRSDAEATWTERYDLLLAVVDVCRLLADWAGLTDAADQAVTVAEAAGDVERAATAAVAPSEGALWQARGHGVTHERLIGALRRAIAALPVDDSPLHCRVMLGLAGELYYASAPLERDALCEQALAMARRLSDRSLIRHALLASFTATWRPATAPARLLLATEALDLATRDADDRGVATALTLQAVAQGELGQLTEMWRIVDRARPLARRLRLAYLLIVLDGLRVPWLTLAGRDAEADEAVGRLLSMLQDAALSQSEEGVAGAILMTQIFRGQTAEAVALLQDMSSRTWIPVDAVITGLLCRLGRVDEASAYLATHPIDLEVEDWLSLLTWGLAAETAIGIGSKELAAATYRRLAPYAGRPCLAGSGAVVGPVDAFLALAAAAVGERTPAARHADNAEELCRRWEIPLAARWLLDQRDRYGI